VRSSADIFGHYINEGFHLCSGLIGLVSYGAEHHTGDYVKNKTEEVLVKLGVAKVGHDDGIFQKVVDNDSNMVKGRHSLPCIDHTIERSVRMLWVEPKVKKSFDKGKKVVTFFKSSTIGRNDLAKVQIELYTRVGRCPLTQTLSCGGSSTCKSSLAWSGWSGSTWLFLPLLCLLRDSSAVWGS
jgi:hypothetical protein